MRKLLFLAVVAIAFNACNESAVSEIKIESKEFTKPMSDSVVMDIESNGNQVEIKGDLSLIEGECIVSLKAPSGDTLFSVDTTFVPDTVFLNNNIDYIFIGDTIFTIDTVLLYDFIYTKSFKAPNKVTIDEKFDRTLGQWTFFYELKEMDDIKPQGSFEFVMKYKD